MGPAPLVIPSIVTLALGSAIGTVIAVKRPLPSLLAAALAGIVPALATWLTVECQSESISNLSAPFARDGAKVVIGAEMDATAGPGGMRCFAEVTLSSGATRKQKLPGEPSRPSGSVVCNSVDVVWCPREQVLVVDESAYHGEALVDTGTTFGDNLEWFGVPSACVVYAALAAAASLLLFASEALRVARRRRVDRAPHPYRGGAPDVPGAEEDRRGTALAFIAIVIALTGAGPLAMVLACR